MMYEWIMIVVDCAITGISTVGLILIERESFSFVMMGGLFDRYCTVTVLGRVVSHLMFI